MPSHRVSTLVFASPESVWAVLLDKMDHPQRYIEDALDVDILERGPGTMIRQLVLPGGVAFRERIESDAARRIITFTLLDHPLYEGTVVNRLSMGAEGRSELVFELDWTLRPGCVDDRDPEEIPALIRSSLLHAKRIAEALESGS